MIVMVASVSIIEGTVAVHKFSRIELRKITYFKTVVQLFFSLIR